METSMKTFIFVSFLFASTLIYSQDRWLYFANDSNTEYYYDTKSICHQSDYVIVWIKSKSTSIEDPSDKDKKRQVDYLVNKVKFFCGKRWKVCVYMEVHYTDGHIEDSGEVEWMEGRLGETYTIIYNIVCGE